MLTAAQKACLEFVQTYTHKHKHSPTIQEIADTLKVRDLSAVWRIIHKLEARGAISRDHARARSIRVLATPRVAMHWETYFAWDNAAKALVPWEPGTPLPPQDHADGEQNNGDESPETVDRVAHPALPPTAPGA